MGSIRAVSVVTKYSTKEKIHGGGLPAVAPSRRYSSIVGKRCLDWMASWIHFDDDSVDTRFETAVVRQEIARSRLILPFWRLLLFLFMLLCQRPVCDRFHPRSSFKKRNISLAQIFLFGLNFLEKLLT